MPYDVFRYGTLEPTAQGRRRIESYGRRLRAILSELRLDFDNSGMSPGSDMAHAWDVVEDRLAAAIGRVEDLKA